METRSIFLKGAKSAPIRLDLINDSLSDLCQKLTTLNLPKFNSEVVENCNFDTKKIVQATIADRILNYFEIPSSDNARQRTLDTFVSWRENEERLKNLKSKFPVTMCIYHKTTAYEIGIKVLAMLQRGMPPVLFSTGESFKAMKGETHIASKLDPKTHTVSFDCYDAWVSLICQTRWLFMPYLVEFYRYGGRFACLQHIHDKRRFIVESVIKQIPDYIVFGSRQAQVPKNNKKNRDIEVNPLGDVVLQKQIGHCFRVVLKEYGIDLDNNQALHRRKIEDNNVSTLDAKAASGSIVAQHIDYMLPLKLTQLLRKVSQEWTLVEDPELDTTYWYRQEKLASMGSGITFELLTCIFLSVSRTYDQEALVYGDDIIVTNDAATDVAEALTGLGFEINWDKSFIKSPLRESCGGFYLSGYGNICTYKLTYSDNPVTGVANMNKLYHILKHYQQSFGEDSFWNLLNQTWLKQTQSIDPVYLGPPLEKAFADSDDLATWVETPSYLKRKKKASGARALFQNNFDAMEIHAINLQYRICDLMVVKTYEKASKVSFKRYNRVKVNCISASYIYQGRASKMLSKNGTFQKIVTKLRLITKDGHILI